MIGKDVRGERYLNFERQIHDGNREIIHSFQGLHVVRVSLDMIVYKNLEMFDNSYE